MCISRFILITLGWYYHSHCKREKTEASDRLRNFNQEGSTVTGNCSVSGGLDRGDLGENGYMCICG